MSLREEIEKSLRREDTEVDAVEDHVMKDSVLEIASADFKEQDVLDLPLTSRKRAGADVGTDYPGKPVSRKKYGLDVGVTLEDAESDSVDDRDSDEEPDSDNELDGLMGFDDESAAEEDHGSEDDEGLEEEESSGGEEDESLEGEDEEDRSTMAGLEGEEEEGSSPLKMFSSSSIESSEIQKGLAVREQLRIWESLLESRIKFEPALMAANQLYQQDKMTDFISNEKTSGSSNLDSAQRALQDLSASWSRLQEALGGQVVPKSSNKRKSAEDVENDDDSENESIKSSEASGNPSEDDVSEAEEEIKAGDEPPSKKLKSSQPPSLDQSYADFAPFRDSEITKWNEKAKISSGKAAQKDFSAFDQSILKLIESILFDKYRLVRKTQLKRSDYMIYGQSKVEQEKQDEKETEEEEGVLAVSKTQGKKDHVYDPEIFDDGDFYQKLLRDFIEGKSTDGGISKHERKLMELHRLRIKMKRKIDTRATKGRKLRYVVHPKLVNYMAPVPTNSFSAEAETQLLKSLFGQTLASSA
ncbi:hypothetical protein GE061_018031 [Apolygus lucorum]|uniref:Uncharacterized protein n=1 Tax=Apolygus lucorum TaxID=248454 RepID=A0A6A4JFD6_APOLU|nr:hypothetical protein GE061_018031 [Apolygus lucorum]